MNKSIKIKYLAPLVLVLAALVLTLAVYAVMAEREDNESESRYEQEYIQEQGENEAGSVVQQPTATPTQSDPAAPASAANIADLAQTLSSLKDSDHDGIIDSRDQHPGEDDFAYAITDNNNDGIADDLE